jgi:hypothetical protein
VNRGVDGEPSELRDLINKRLTLNLLIQGIAEHTCITAHHLVRDELTEIDPELVQLYDKMGAMLAMNHWTWESKMFFGGPKRFWKRAKTSPQHPFFHHRLLARHGSTLERGARRFCYERGKARGVWRWFQVIHAVRIYLKCERREREHKPQLIRLAKQAANMVMGIPVDRFRARLTDDVAFGRLRPMKTLKGKVLRLAAAGYSGVIREGDELRIVARAMNWTLLAHELVKGTAELICMHGINTLDRETYLKVIEEADRLEYEPPLLMAGGQLWRHLLPLLPDGIPMANMLMHIAMLGPMSLESLMLAVIEQPKHARRLLAKLPPD